MFGYKQIKEKKRTEQAVGQHGFKGLNEHYLFSIQKDYGYLSAFFSLCGDFILTILPRLC